MLNNLVWCPSIRLTWAFGRGWSTEVSGSSCLHPSIGSRCGIWSTVHHLPSRRNFYTALFWVYMYWDGGWSWGTKKRSCLPPPDVECAESPWSGVNQNDKCAGGIPPQFQCPDQLPASVHLDPPRQPEASAGTDAKHHFRDTERTNIPSICKGEDEKRPDHEARFSVLSSKCRQNSAWNSL